MHKRFIAAALVAPLIAFAPALAWAHHCKSGYRHHHHARNADNATFGSSKSMNKGGKAGAQDTNRSTGAGSTDQGATGGSTTSGGKSGGGI